MFYIQQNALELSAPASPLLLQQQQEQRQSKNHQQKSIPLGWLQLAGHPERCVNQFTKISNLILYQITICFRKDFTAKKTQKCKTIEHIKQYSKLESHNLNTLIHPIYLDIETCEHNT